MLVLPLLPPLARFGSSSVRVAADGLDDAAAGWLDTMIDGDHGRMRYSGAQPALPLEIVDALHRVLFTAALTAEQPAAR